MSPWIDIPLAVVALTMLATAALMAHRARRWRVLLAAVLAGIVIGTTAALLA